MRRAATFRVTSEVLCAIFREGLSETHAVDGLPPGARIVGARYDGFTHTVEFAVEGEGLPACEEGAVPASIEIKAGRIA